MNLNIFLAQINTSLGDTESNLEKHLETIEEAQEQGADLIIFPELSLTGYALQDLAPAVALSPNSTDRIFSPLLERSKEIDIVVVARRGIRRYDACQKQAEKNGSDIRMHHHHRRRL